MESNKATEHDRDSQRQTPQAQAPQAQAPQAHESQHHYGSLDNRYGKIGISAVAAAVRCKDKPHGSHKRRHVPAESD